MSTDADRTLHTRTVLTLNEWRAEGRRRFGDDFKAWKFVCPVCGNVQSWEDFATLGFEDEEIVGRVYFSCIGRWTKDAPGTLSTPGAPCDYTNGGLFDLSKMAVLNEAGRKCSVFEFAEVTA